MLAKPRYNPDRNWKYKQRPWRERLNTEVWAEENRFRAMQRVGSARLLELLETHHPGEEHAHDVALVLGTDIPDVAARAA